MGFNNTTKVPSTNPNRDSDTHSSEPHNKLPTDYDKHTSDASNIEDARSQVNDPGPVTLSFEASMDIVAEDPPLASDTSK